jgi:hypothetical protein
MFIKIFLQRKLKVFIFITAAISLCGCSYLDGHPGLKEISTEPSTFIVAPRSPFKDSRDGVKAIRVCKDDIRGYDPSVIWEIRAIKHISLEAFRLKIGQVPEGFIQIIPPNGTPFVPSSGTHYLVGASFAHPSARPWSYTTWVAP